jgi:uncharacterized membrane-anchored protein YitT (DUF2179 family)
LILSYIYFGKYYLFKTFIVVLLLSTFTDILKEVLKIEAITHDILLAAIFGGIFIGLVLMGKSIIYLRTMNLKI